MTRTRALYSSSATKGFVEWVERLVPRPLRHRFAVVKHSNLWCHRLLPNRDHLRIRDGRHMFIFPKFGTNCNGKQPVWNR